MYKLYAQSKTEGWKIIKTHTKLEIIEKESEKLTCKEYYSYIIKEVTKEGDRLIKQQTLLQECKVEYSDNVKVDFEVKAMTFKPSRMKQKEELRRMTEDYLR